MKLPQNYIPDLDHRITVLLSFTVRGETGFFAKQGSGDLYSASLEGAGIMLRALIEFTGVKSSPSSRKLIDAIKPGDAVLGFDVLNHISQVRVIGLDQNTADFLARMHDEAAKRTAHPAFNKIATGLDPSELARATDWVIREIWLRCYDPDPITIHPDLFDLLEHGKWRGIPFQPAK